MRKEFKILSVNISERKGEQKKPVSKIFLKENYGIEGDAHAGKWHRQVSFLANEDIETMRAKGVELDYGDFAENITTQGIDLASLPVGTRLFMGNAVVEVTQIGKSCHHDCAVFRLVGDCVMPRRGIFAKVIKAGEISPNSYSYYEM